MNQGAITIDKNNGELAVSVQKKPHVEEINNALQALLGDEARAISVSLPASLATEFMLVQVLTFLRREGKTVSIRWNDHAPSTSMQQIIQSLNQ